MAAAAGSTAKGSDFPGFFRQHRRLLLSLLTAAAIAGFVYYVVPQIAGLGPTLRRLRAANAWWLVLGGLVEALSIAGLIVLMRGVFVRFGSRVRWQASTQITLAGGAATKLFATAGAGGVAVTVWALRASGLTEQSVATGMVCYEILNYSVYMVALAVCGFGLWSGVLAGAAPIGLTLIPAIFGTAVIVIVVAMSVASAPLERYFSRWAERSTGRRQRSWRRAAALPRSVRSGMSVAVKMLRDADPTFLGVLAAWGFDIAALWASFRAFGQSPPAGVLVMGYYVGTLANTLPLPGGIGGVEGGMIGSFIAFGVSPPLAVLAVLAYRTISYWLPTIPGAIAYVRLRHTVAAWRVTDGATAAAHGQTKPSHPGRGQENRQAAA